ncbi:putative uncharacterized protein [Bacteroides sp. CAG:709]|nr:putative uncharacterized protein [Bacteroides sp. CAG:709]
MNKLYTGLALLAAVSLASCKAEGPDDGGKQIPSESTTLTLTPFEKLNASADAVNSHKDDWAQSVLTLNYRSIVNVGASVLGTDSPSYSRIVKLADGSYILTAHDYYSGGNGSTVYWATSQDLVNWTPQGKLFASRSVVNARGQEATRLYTNGFGKVLSNGDVLMFASFRTTGTYSFWKWRNEQGIEMRRSKDNGKTWSEPYEVYRGPNWEAIMLEDGDGELELYFSESRPWISGSHSGTSMVRSTDGGKTWLPGLGKEPYRVIRHTWYDAHQDKWLFTDQMPGLIILNDSKCKAGVFESAHAYPVGGSVNFCISFAWSPEDGNWNYIEGEEKDGTGLDVKTAKVGPADRKIDVWNGAAPSLLQFPSGETVVSYGQDAYQWLRIGDSQARNFGAAGKYLPAKGSWSSILLDGTHELITHMRNSTDSKNVGVTICKLALNHRIAASSHKVVIDGGNSDWVNADDALFAGSKCQAQATLRCAADADNIYFLVECRDENVSKDDYVQVFIAPSDAAKLNAQTLRVKVGLNGLRNQGVYAGNWIEKDLGANAVVRYDATLSDASDVDNGWLAEISVPRSSVKVVDGKVKVNLALFDMEGGEDAIVSTGEKNPQKWITVTGL